MAGVQLLMSTLLLTTPDCERPGCTRLLIYGEAVVVFMNRTIDINAGRSSRERFAELVKVYCSHRCEALARPIPPWSDRLPRRRGS
jgi:hypothetical protein